MEPTIERLQRIEQATLALPALNEVDRWALTRTRQRLEHLSSGPLHDCTPTFPPRFLHGDYWGGNVFFLGGQPVPLINREQTPRAPRA